MSTTQFREVINAPSEAVWEVLFNQYGDIHKHNPTMVASEYIGDASKGALNISRRCMFDDKLYVDEKITEVVDQKSFKVEVYDHNLPMLKDMAATYELSQMAADKTEVIMTSMVSTSPGFMVFLMKGQLGKGLKKHLFGLKYYLETGETVNEGNYTEIFKDYSQKQKQ